MDTQFHCISRKIFHSLFSAFFVAHVINRVAILILQFMKERRQKEEAHRSAVSGKKIKLKIKKSSKDKEVNVNLFYYIDTSVLLENTPTTRKIHTNHIRDSSGVFSMSSLVRISMLSLISSLSLKIVLKFVGV